MCPQGIEPAKGKLKKNIFNIGPGGREEAGHLVAKGGVVRVLHDGHQLYGVVALKKN